MPRPPLPLQQRAVIVGSAALLGWLLLWQVVSPSERWHALLVPLWGLNFWLSGGKIGRNASIYGAGIFGGVAAFLFMAGEEQARQIGAGFHWGEPWLQLYFAAGLFVIYNALCALLNALISLSQRGKELLAAPRGWPLRLFRIGVALCLFAPYLYAAFNVHRFKYQNATDPQRARGLAYENVVLRAEDGATLRGWWLPGSSRKTIILVHGLQANRGDMLGLAPFLHDAGFNLFLFDLRGHGDSSGRTISFGVREANDVRAAVNYAARRSDSIGLFAVSMGGSAALHALQSDGLPPVRAFALDSTFAEFAPLARVQMQFLPDGVARPLLKMLSFYAKLEIGASLEEITPRRFIAQIAPRPLLLIHGTADSMIPPGQAKINFAAARGPKTMYWIAGANHCEGHGVAGDEYEKRLVEFFEKAL